MESEMPDSQHLEHWKAGVIHFNKRRFWECHESWETGWLELPPNLKLHVQAMIQIAAVLHLTQIGRIEPARRLAVLASEKLRPITTLPRIEIVGSPAFLRRILTLDCDFESEVKKEESSLRAELFLG